MAGDAFFGFLRRGRVEPWRPESAHQNEVVTEGAAAATGRYVTGGYTVIYDGVVGPWFLPTFAAATGLDTLQYVVLMPELETCVQRVATRVGHGFTDAAATRKMHHEFAVADVDPRHVLRYPPGDAEVVASLIIDGDFGYQLRPGRK